MEIVLVALLSCKQSENAIQKVYRHKNLNFEQRQEVIQQIILISEKDCPKKDYLLNSFVKKP